MFEKIYSTVVLDLDGNILYEESYYPVFWDGPVARCCGASKEQKQTYQDQSSLFHQMSNQAQQVFGSSSQVFKDLTNTFAPIVAAGPNQEGFSPAEKSALVSSSITNTGVAARNAMTAVKQAQAAVGGGNLALPGGSEVGQQLSVANSAAAQNAKNLTDIDLANYDQGRKNYQFAAAGLAGAPQVFNPATSAGSAATSAGNAAADTANQITQANNSWVSAVTGLAGGILGTAISPGGFFNKAKPSGGGGGSLPAGAPV